jgi:hypothetical protein
MSHYRIDLLKKALQKGLWAFFTQTYYLVRNSLSHSDHERVYYKSCSDVIEASSTFDLEGCSIITYDSWDEVPLEYKKILQETPGIFWNSEEWMSRGFRIWFGIIDNDVAIIKFTCSGDKIDNFYFPLTSRCILNYYTFTLPQYRGRGLNSLLGRYSRSVLIQDGFEHFFSVIDEYNTSSIIGTEKSGYRNIGNGITKRSTGKRIWYPKN